MNVGLATNTGAVSGINTGYVLGKIITLASSSSYKGADTPYANGCFFDHVAIRCTPSTGAMTVYAYLCWDVLGERPVTAVGSCAELVQSLTTPTLYTAHIYWGEWCRPDASQTDADSKTGTIYLMVKTSTGTLDIAAGGAELHFTDAFSRSA